MSLALLTKREAVLAAIAEYDRLGADAFLQRYGFRRANAFFLVQDGRRYDSKAIAGVAVGKEHPERGPLKSGEFAGGEATVRAKLEALGFTVEVQRVPTPNNEPLTPEATLAAIQALWGAPYDQTQKLAAWRTPGGRELALQLDATTVNLIWTELPPRPDPGLVVKQYLPEKSRNSNLRHLASRLAQPFEAWQSQVRTRGALEALLTWYEQVPPVELDEAALSAMRGTFLQHMEGFETFEAPGSVYGREEREYKDELADLFRGEVLPLSTSANRSDADAVKLTVAFADLLNRKLTSTGKPQNLINWRYLDVLNHTNEQERIIFGRALGGLLAAEDRMIDRMAGYLGPARHAFTGSGSAFAGDAARVFGSCALMLASPQDAIIVRVTLFDAALTRLAHSRLPTNQDELGRFRDALDLAQRLQAVLSRWGWAPKDLIDVQGFLFVALMYGEGSAETRAAEEVELEEAAAPQLTQDVYGLDEALADLFIERSDLERFLSIWRSKKNLILQGAPGVGKTFVARRLAYAMIRAHDPRRVAAVQFHQSYGYEDFIQGFRPTAGGGFQLKDGLFYRFCLEAQRDLGRDYVFIIDEINRGNLSKIFGELMLLVESDKRSPEWAAKLAYSTEDTDPFWIPPNLYVLGMMNTADRSLSLVDYALRRRFAFVTLEPAFASAKFQAHLLERGVPQDMVDHVVGRMIELNDEIAADKVNLGPGFRIGHSFFVPQPSFVYRDDWLRQIIDTEIRSLLEEYWFDEPQRAEDWTARLLDAR